MTTLSEITIEAEAAILDEAEQHRTPARQSTAAHPDMTIDDAYAVQAAWVARKVARGRRVVGHKIGLTSRAMQQAMKIDTPDSGVLLDDMVFEDGDDIEAAAFIDPRIEVELAFVLAEPLAGPDVTVTDVLDATAWVVPAVELIAARTWRVDPETGRSRTVVDTIADNAADAGIVTGGRPVRPDAVDLRWVGATLTRNGVIEETGLAAGVLGHPARGIAWLARRYADHELRLESGQVILAGSFTRPVPVVAGDTFAVDFGPLGSFGVNFV
ncbi:MAG: 2-oxo-hepta-3-ene-1,7-dioic acid hydratase [Actinomycetota bacterium]|nr:2-oxo-hepta-3-ene-1,7-dioic acid hydratase [Actinomycetota bacterium]